MSNLKIVIRQLLAGIATRIPGLRELVFKRFYQETGGTNDLKYCFQVWARHLSALRGHGWDTEGKKILEIGPGDSLGIGIIQVLMGAKSYQAVDALTYQVIENSSRILDEIKELFANGDEVQDRPEIFPFFKDTQTIIENIAKVIKCRPDLDSKIEELKRDLRNLADPDYDFGYLGMINLEDYLKNPKKEAYDLVFSQSVFEYIGNPKGALDQINLQLRLGGFSSHEVDLGCMRTSKYWDGHWAYSQGLWNFAMCKRPLYINRFTYQKYIHILEEQASKILTLEKMMVKPEVIDTKLKPPYNEMDRESRACKALYFLVKK